MTLSPVAELTSALIERASVTPQDCGCLDLIGQRLEACGFRLTRLPSADVDNLWAVRGDSGLCLAFAGHTDVVPTGSVSDWRFDPFRPTVVDGYLYGRGAADMKGSLAAMVTAVENFIAAKPNHNGRLAFMLTSDEEGPATDGTIKITEYLTREKIAVDWCVVGEPSSSEILGDTVRVGRRGSLNGHLTVRGVQGHVAYPDQADNPIHTAIPALAELAAKIWDEGNAFYPPSSFQISNIQAGTGAENVIPGTLVARFNFRFCTEQTAAGLRAEVESVLRSHALDFELDWRLSGNPFLTESGRLIEAVTAAVTGICGIEPVLSTGGGTSDGRFIAPLGIEVVELGPNNATIHKVDECVRIDELEQLSHVYQTIIERLLEA